MFNSTVLEYIKREAIKLGIEWEALAACVQAESGGVSSARVNGNNEPLIRWEGHYFYRLLPQNKKEAGLKSGLASRSAGAVKNPKSQQDRYNKLLYPAMKINRAAAIGSCSWGVGQVMGDHWQRLGFRSPDDFMNLARSGIEGQIDIMIRFIKMSKLVDELKSRNWQAFERVYNGPAAKGAYAKKMAENYRLFKQGKIKIGNKEIAGGTAGVVGGGTTAATGEVIKEQITPQPDITPPDITPQPDITPPDFDPGEVGNTLSPVGNQFLYFGSEILTWLGIGVTIIATGFIIWGLYKKFGKVE